MSSGWGRGWSQPYIIIEPSESESDSDCSSDTPTLPVSSDRSYKEIYVQAIAAVFLKLNLIEQEYLVAHKKAQRRTHSINLRASTDIQRQQRRMPL